MVRTITLWMLIGLVVACCWVVIGLFLDPHGLNLGRSNLVAFTAPAALLGRKMPLGVVSFILLNGGLYGFAGLVIGLARSLHSAQQHA